MTCLNGVYDNNINYRDICIAMESKNYIKLLPVLLDYNLLLIVKSDIDEAHRLPRIVIIQYDTYKNDIMLCYAGFTYTIKYINNTTIIKLSNKYQSMSKIKRTIITKCDELLNIFPSYRNIIKVFVEVMKFFPYTNEITIISHPGENEV